MAEMRIRLVVPITGLSGSAIQERLDYLNGVADPGTVVDAVQVEVGPPAIESKVDEVRAGPEVLRLVKGAEEDGCDAAIIWCGSDPSLEASRQVVDIPVIGPGEAMRAISTMLGREPVRIVPDIPVLEMRVDLGETVEAIRSEVLERIGEGDGDVFLLGCLALWGLGSRLRDEIGVPILDGAEASLKMAELCVRLGLRHSRVAYPRFPPEHRSG
ncbi:MAG: aspartate/glutamate racemase family protein [Candidatus Bathyarchaeota archaeon]|jgi:allantoin racemase